MPTHVSHSQVVQYIDSLPNEDKPEIFGMHSNANLAFLRASFFTMSKLIMTEGDTCHPKKDKKNSYIQKLLKILVNIECKNGK